MGKPLMYDPPSRRPQTEVLAVAWAHGSRVAATWSGWALWDVRAACRKRGMQCPTDVATTMPRPDCSCPRCVEWRATRVPNLARAAAMLANGYGPATVARLTGVPVEAVRARAARRVEAHEWRSIG